jgi:leucine efflux protein
MEALGVIQFWTFLSGVIVIILMPGPNSLFVLKTSISQGPHVAWQAIAAVLLGDAVLILLSYLGVASLLLASPELFRWVRYLGAAYLLYLGVQMLLSLRQKSTAKATDAAVTDSGTTDSGLRSAGATNSGFPGPVFRKSLLLSLTNPKAILFYLSFFIQFIDYSFSPAWLPYLVLALVLELVSLCYLTVLIYAGHHIAGYFRHQPLAAQAGNLVLGLLFSAFAVRLVLV